MKSLLLIAAIFTFSFMFLSCASSSFVDLNSLKQELNVRDFPEQKDYPDADAVLLSEVHDVKVYIDENYDVGTIESITKVEKLFKNIEDYAFVEIPTSSGDKLTDLCARTIKPDGTVIELKDEDFHTATGGGEGYIFYSDRKLTKFTFPAIEKNCIIEYHYTIREAYPFIQDEWRIQSYIPKMMDIYRLTVPILLMAPKKDGGADWSWRYHVLNCELDKPVVSTDLWSSNREDKTVTYMWTKKDVPAFEPDPMMPCHDQFLQYIKFAPSDWKTWTDVSKSYYEKRFKPQLNITDEISNKAKELTKDCTSDREKIEKVYAFVQTLRYVAIQLGEGGYIPAEPQTVLERNYGDCKDKSILLIGLLRSLNINASPVLLITSNEGVIRPDFPSWEFNHMIVKATTADKKDYWMDPTVDHCPLGQLPDHYEGVHALVLNDDNTSQIETIPESKYAVNVEDINMKVTIPTPNETDFDITMKFKGQSNFSSRSFLNEKTHDEMIKFCRSLVADDYLNAEIVDYSFSNLDPVDSALAFNFKLKAPNAMERQGDLIFLNIDPFKLSGDWSWLARDKRTYDIEFSHPRTVNKTIELTIPENKYAVRNMPDYTYLTTDGLYYKKSYENNGSGHLTMNETFTVKSKRLNAGNFKKIKTFVESMRTKAKERIVLTAK